MKIQNLKCPDCNATLEMDLNDNTKVLFCPYCGSQLYIDEEKHEFNIHINKTSSHTTRTIDDAEIKKAEAQLKWVENEILKTKLNAKESKMIGITLIVLFVGFFGGLCLYGSYDEKQREQAIETAISEGKIQAGYYGDYVGQKYEAVEEQLEALGFTNIEIIDLKDSGIKFWSNGEVESISIDGKTNFSKNDYFFPNDKIIITYH